jgi:hypothetical protein
VLFAASDGDPAFAEAEQVACSKVNFRPDKIIRPKEHLGNLYAGAAAVQVGLAATVLGRLDEKQAQRSAVVNCFGWGDEQAAFVLEAA